MFIQPKFINMYLISIQAPIKLQNSKLSIVVPLGVLCVNIVNFQLWALRDLSAGHVRPGPGGLGQDGGQLLLGGTADDGLLLQTVFRVDGGHQAHETGQNVGPHRTKQDELRLVVGQIELHLPLNSRNLSEHQLIIRKTKI